MTSVSHPIISNFFVFLHTKGVPHGCISCAPPLQKERVSGQTPDYCGPAGTWGTMAPGRYRGTPEEEEQLLLPAGDAQNRGSQWYRRHPWRKGSHPRLGWTTGLLLCSLAFLSVFAIFVSFQSERAGVSSAAESPTSLDLHQNPGD